MKYFICVSLILAGCSNTMTEQQCSETNWHTRGISDAWAGKYLNTANEYMEQCAEYGVQPDLRQWRKGYLSALHQQCPASKAFELAANQQNYAGPCLADTEFKKTLSISAEEAKQKMELHRIETRLQEIQIAKGSADKGQQQDLSWEEYQLQQELLDIKGTLQITEPEPLNKFLFEK
ncbi:DUF2799 domain-containing protein [Tolumonas osonensis]|uniref:DUF2799 domain-containing protein n=1 Tax=Tolumonas osonensis TaxID=675874 RepID=A0A841G8N7_9GAMM|nr:DUF2799 domain-containing protein [Tolumonas osonensis]MBB6055358.1 hypothetical protein [Tolumonas osonensis]